MSSILLVDDSMADAKLIRYFAERVGVCQPIEHVTSGPEALKRLESSHPLPGLLLLDINMPGMNGHELLTVLRSHSHPNIARIPVVVLKTSNYPDEVRQAYSEGANSYVVKLGPPVVSSAKTTISDSASSGSAL
jgi:two-component system response regulator